MGLEGGKGAATFGGLGGLGFKVLRFRVQGPGV